MTCCEAIGRLSFSLFFAIGYATAIMAGLVTAASAAAAGNILGFGVALGAMIVAAVALALQLNWLDTDWRNMCNACIDDLWFSLPLDSPERGCARACSDRPGRDRIERFRNTIWSGSVGPNLLTTIVLFGLAGMAFLAMPVLWWLFGAAAFAVFAFLLYVLSTLLDWRKTARRITDCVACT